MNLQVFLKKLNLKFLFILCFKKKQMCGIRDAGRVAKALELFIADEPSAVSNLVLGKKENNF